MRADPRFAGLWEPETSRNPEKVSLAAALRALRASDRSLGNKDKQIMVIGCG